MKSSDGGVRYPALRWFCVQRLPPLIDAFEREIDGVRAAEDIEYIHRMRVASRRLRAALPLFRPCFTAKQYTGWMLGITRITRALGNARDMDVQIAYLRKYLKKQEKTGARTGSDAADVRSGSGPAVEFLLASLVQQRGQLQVPVIRALDSLGKSGIIGEMQAVLAGFARSISAQRRRPPLHALSHIAAYRIGKRLATLLSFEPWIRHPDAVAEHHATRIAAKKLRYTLEVYGPLYRSGLKKHHARVRRVQEILGDLHDCDVWIDKITTLLLKERTLLRSEKSPERPDPETLSSLRLFLSEKERERRDLYRRFIRYWAMLVRTRIWPDLQDSLYSRRKNAFIAPSMPSPEEAIAQVEDLALAYPEALAHSRHVTELALMLFDSTIPVHRFADPDRLLLECAGLLHDIGLESGQKGHNRRGARAVLADEQIPFDYPDRSIIALCIALHRGGMNTEGDPVYVLLNEEDRKRALGLASLLRIADALDFLHAGNVRTVRAQVMKERVILHVGSVADCSEEKDRARKNAVLFTGIFSKTVVIP